MKRKIIYVIIHLIAGGTFAQQDPQFSQYMFNTLALNPAYAGSREVLSVTANYRRQWVGMEGAPTTATISADMPVKKEKIGLGLFAYDDHLGVTHNAGAYFSYAYRIKWGKGTLALGLQVGANQYSIDLASVNHSNGQNTDVAFASNVSDWLPNFGAGLYYNTDKWYFGVSMPRGISYERELGQTQSISITKYRHFFSVAGYVFKLNEIFKLKPSIMLKEVRGAPFQADYNLNLWMYDKFAIGASYRGGNTIVGMFELQINPQFRVGYAYDYTMGPISDYSSGSHEVMLRYEFGFYGQKINNPRFF